MHKKEYGKRQTVQIEDKLGKKKGFMVIVLDNPFLCLQFDTLIRSTPLVLVSVQIKQTCPVHNEWPTISTTHAPTVSITFHAPQKS